MTKAQIDFSYPSKQTIVVPFSSVVEDLFPAPPGLVEDVWPPTQLSYLIDYLKGLECRTVVIESHYIDRDYDDDMAAFYSRSLRSYRNYCQRLHFFSEQFDQKRWGEFVTSTADLSQIQSNLQRQYLGFCVVKPLPGPRIGRTILVTLGPESDAGTRRNFSGVHEYEVHLSGFTLKVKGLPFQQQDQGVSACATVALWSSLHNLSKIEGFLAPTPAQITVAASRYLLSGGRSLPSEGLAIPQICEAIRASGLEPLIVRAITLAHDRAQLLGYMTSGFAPVLFIQQPQGGIGHAVCAVGVKLGQIQPPDPSLGFCNGRQGHGSFLRP